MKITGYEVDWKDDFEDEVIEEMLVEVSGTTPGRGFTEEYDVSGEVDARLLIISSEYLDTDQLGQVWEAGDLGVADKVFEGTFDEILAQLRQNLAENE